VSGDTSRASAAERPAPKLFLGTVMHRRLRPAANQFLYRVFFLAIPLSNVTALRTRWFGVNRWNLLGFDFRDHGARDGSHPLEWIRALLAREGLAVADGEVWLQAFPRVLGYVFNPVSFWMCHDRAARLRAIVCEVNNTFGERHCYVLAHPDARPISPGETLSARKVFHVSPFCRVEGEYRFRFVTGGARALARIDYRDAAGDLLHTSVSGRAAPYSSRALLGAFCAHPWMTLGVVVRIHWQALKLWAKRVPFFPKPVPPLQEVTR
jgi:DUF1365 family protein